MILFFRLARRIRHPSCMYLQPGQWSGTRAVASRFGADGVRLINPPWLWRCGLSSAVWPGW
jgi:hypothetical protein